MAVCNKQHFDKKTALTALNERKRNSRKYAKECRVYKCDVCKNSWHLTSREEYAEIETIPLEELIYKDDWIKLKMGSD